MVAAGPTCSLSRHWLSLVESLRSRREHLLLRLADQVDRLPQGNESWLHTERELMAAERALQRLQAV